MTCWLTLKYARSPCSRSRTRFASAPTACRSRRGTAQRRRRATGARARAPSRRSRRGPQPARAPAGLPDRREAVLRASAQYRSLALGVVARGRLGVPRRRARPSRWRSFARHVRGEARSTELRRSGGASALNGPARTAGASGRLRGTVRRLRAVELQLQARVDQVVDALRVSQAEQRARLGGVDGAPHLARHVQALARACALLLVGPAPSFPQP